MKPVYRGMIISFKRQIRANANNRRKLQQLLNVTKKKNCSCRRSKYTFSRNKSCWIEPAIFNESIIVQLFSTASVVCTYCMCFIYSKTTYLFVSLSYFLQLLITPLTSILNIIYVAGNLGGKKIWWFHSKQVKLNIDGI